MTVVNLSETFQQSNFNQNFIEISTCSLILDKPNLPHIQLKSFHLLSCKLFANIRNQYNLHDARYFTRDVNYNNLVNTLQIDSTGEILSYFVKFICVNWYNLYSFLSLENNQW